MKALHPTQLWSVYDLLRRKGVLRNGGREARPDIATRLSSRSLAGWLWIPLKSFKMRKHISRLRSFHNGVLGFIWGLVHDHTTWLEVLAPILTGCGPRGKLGLFPANRGVLSLLIYWCLKEKRRYWSSAWCVMLAIANCTFMRTHQKGTGFPGNAREPTLTQTSEFEGGSAQSIVSIWFKTL